MIGAFEPADGGYASLNMDGRTFVPLPALPSLIGLYKHFTLADTCSVGGRMFVDVRKLLEAPPSGELSTLLVKLNLAGLISL